MQNTNTTTNADPATLDTSTALVDESQAVAGRMKMGAIYAIGVETAAARGALAAMPLLAALSEGRPCVLITPLDPEKEEFTDFLRGTPGAEALADSVRDGRVKLFVAIGDYGVNLFMRGAVGFVRELDHFGVDLGTLVVVDQADDLFTAHDHMAAVNQAKAYREWCRSHGHTMLMLYLRTSQSRPILDGNQAALQQFSGVARVHSERGELQMTLDFWRSPGDYRVGTAMSLDAFWQSPQAAPDAARSALAEQARPRAGPPTEAVPAEFWYAGPYDAAFDALIDTVRWRTVEGIDDILRSGAAGMGALVVFDAAEDFSTFVERIVALRRMLGESARIVVRESRYRLREHLQRRMLLKAGADAVLAKTEPVATAASLLLAPRHGVAPDAAAPGGATMDHWAEIVAANRRIGVLPAAHFTIEAEEVLRRSSSLEIPCTLAEVHVEGDGDTGSPAGERFVTRTGDLSTSSHGAKIFLLHGCRERDAMEVVTRWIGNAGDCAVDHITLFTGDASIAKRLGHLRVEAMNDPTAAEAQDATLSVVDAGPTDPAPALGGPEPFRHSNVAITAAVAVLFGFALNTPSMAQSPVSDSAGTVTAPAAAADSATRAYQEERYADVARLGLSEVSQRPDDHALRLKVANSLAWTGQYPQAVQQYLALTNSPLAAEATLGLANVYLWEGRPHLAQPLFQSVLARDPAQPDALAGVAKLRRDLRPRTTVRVSTLDDSGAAERSGLGVSHRWRDAGLHQIFELAAEGGKEQRSPDTGDLQPREISFAYEHLGLPLTPRVEVSAQNSPTSKLFGEVSARLAGSELRLTLGRVNWGKLVFDPRALRDGLAANRVGLAGATDTPVGQVAGSFGHFSVSDGNRVQEFSLRYTPRWQPVAARSGLKLFTGLYGRTSEQQVDRYWSPDGYYTADVGLALGRWEAEWQLEGELKRSFGIGGEGANGWALGAGALRWLNRDWAVRGNLAYQETRRTGSRYQYDSLSVGLIRVW